MYVPLALKKSGDFTVSESIRLQIFKFFGGWVWTEGIRFQIFKFFGGWVWTEGIRLQIFKFFGGWVWSERKKKKNRHERIVSDHHGHPLVNMMA
jgi:hypothetical protein